MPPDTPVAQRKAALRREMLARRDALPPPELDRLARAFVARLLALPQYASARSVLSTLAIGSEWSARAFLDRARADGKAVILPRVTPPPRHLALHEVMDLDRQLVPGVWDIPEPDPGHCPARTLADVDFALVPALAADREGFRLGYGAGYFDRLLAGRAPGTFCVSAVASGFVLDAVPREAHDVPVDLVLDETGPLAMRPRGP